MAAAPFAPLELLAPARDLEAAMAAVDHGADAVYMGGPAFGARAAAGNSMDDVARAAQYAARYHARVYLTLNTVLFDDELEAARRAAWQAWDAGVSALIVQDMALLELDLPPVELHASTQCDVRTPAKAAFLDASGFSQVVLARELTLGEIAACRAAMPRARIEFFVHGALCVSYSGQCYLSSALTGRSANRGACAQLCRLPYDVYDFRGRRLARAQHVLSLKDNDQTANLEALVAAGVTSFKIEGRLKDAGYVKNITAHYRRELDALIAAHAAEGWRAASLGKARFSFEPDPGRTFTRGATDYFVNGRRPVIAETATPKSIGSPAAVVRLVKASRPQSLTVQPLPGVELAAGDGLVYRTPEGGVEGLRVNRAEPLPRGLARVLLRDDVRGHPGLAPGVTLMRNRDHAFLKILAGGTARRAVEADLELGLAGGALELRASAAGVSALARAAFA
ncbi:MAG: U32 family peptidase, partial [Duodenibacillus sp.]|nr:U32 family peptidase [Duodenibacillus sp.]